MCGAEKARTAGKAAGLEIEPCATRLAQPPVIPAKPVPAKAGSGNPRQGITNRRMRTNQCMRHARAFLRSSKNDKHLPEWRYNPKVLARGGWCVTRRSGLIR